jgi:hypothetical protein
MECSSLKACSGLNEGKKGRSLKRQDPVQGAGHEINQYRIRGIVLIEIALFK